jgi:hypothetical protein
MTEKLQPNNTQSKFNQFKSWLNKIQTDSMNANLEIAATGQTPLRRAMAKVESMVTGDNTKADTLAQDLIDYRYETARLQRKAARESKGQTFEQAVLEDIAIKEQAKKDLAKAKIEQPTTNLNNSEKSIPTNTITDRLKALAALALLSGNMMMTPNALADNKIQAESNSPTKTEQVKNETQTEQQQVETLEQLIEGKGVSKGGIKAGLSVKGLEAKFTIRAKHNGENPAKITITVKDQVAKARQLIQQGQSETVAYILTSLESDNAKAQKSKDEANKKLSDERIYKDAIAGLRGEKEAKVETKKETPKPILKTETTAKTDAVKNKVEKELKPYKTMYFDTKDFNLVDYEITNKEYIEILEAWDQDNKCNTGYYVNCKKSGKVYDKNMQFEINGKKYIRDVYFYPYDVSKPETIDNTINPNYFVEGVNGFVKATHRGRVVIIRPSQMDFGELRLLQKKEINSWICKKCIIGYEGDSLEQVNKNAEYFSNHRKVVRGWFGGLELE